MMDKVVRLERDVLRFVGSFSGSDAALFFGAVVLVLLLGWYLLTRAGFWKHPKVRYTLAWGAETALLLVLLGVAVFWKVWLRDPQWLPGDGSHAHKSMLFVLAAAFATLAGLLILSRIRMPAALFMVLSVAWVSGLGWLMLRTGYLPVLDDIYARHWGAETAAMLPKIPLPGDPLQVFKIVLWVLFPFLCGIYCARRSFAVWKFTMGSLLSGWVIGCLVTPMITVSRWLAIAPAVFTLVGVVMLLLPIQRAALERLLGIPLHRDPERIVTPGSVTASILGHAVVVAMVVALGGLTVVGYLDREMVRCITDGPEGVHRAPFLRNAYPILKHRFMRNTDTKLPDGFERACFKANGCFDSHILDKEAWEKHDVAKVRQALTELSVYFDDFTSASQCDYVDWPRRSSMLSFLAVRETARALHTKAMLAIHDGDTTTAAASIEPLLGFSGILRDYPMLVCQMIGVAVAGIASDACYQYYTALRDQPAAMDQLARVLDNQRENTYVRLDYESLRRGEPGFWPVTTFFEILVPAFLRADMNTRGRHVQMQQMRIAVALERYRAHHGAFPATLDALAPDYLPRLPIDPFEGKPYVYEPRGNEFTLTISHKCDQKFEQPFEFPPPTLEQWGKRERENQARRASQQVIKPRDAKTTTPQEKAAR